VGRPETAPELPSVSIDNRTAAREITERLVATGRIRMGMIAAGVAVKGGRDRLAGFRDALGEGFDPDLVVDVPLYSFHSGQEGMRALLERAPDVDGLFAASDAIAAGAVDVLRAQGKRVPEDVGVVGFDDSAWALRCQPALSTVRQPADRLGARAAELVLDEIRTGERRSGVVLLPTEVIWRDSA
jgi:DNA-binding LacI/PurR family transcriptional regulator